MISRRKSVSVTRIYSCGHMLQYMALELVLCETWTRTRLRNNMFLGRRAPQLTVDAGDSRLLESLFGYERLDGGNPDVVVHATETNHEVWLRIWKIDGRPGYGGLRRAPIRCFASRFKTSQPDTVAAARGVGAPERPGLTDLIRCPSASL